MDVGAFLQVTAVGEIDGASNPVINVWDFECLVASDVVGLEELGPYFVDAFLIRYVSPLLPFYSTHYSLNTVRLRQYGLPSQGYDGTGLGQVGGASGNMAPAFVTYSVQLTRNNFAMRNGRKALPAVPTSVITGAGLITEATRLAFEAVFEAWETTDFLVEAGEADFTFAERIIRKPPTLATIPTVVSAISGYALNGFGTQNSRK